jgi:hypothetical protein
MSYGMLETGRLILNASEPSMNANMHTIELTFRTIHTILQNTSKICSAKQHPYLSR